MRRNLLHGLALSLAAVLLVACPDRTQKVPPVDPTKSAKTSTLVRVLVVDDKPLAEAIVREWKARAEGEIEVRNVASEEAASLKKLAADVVVYPSGLLGELVERDLLVPLPDDLLADEQFARRDILPLSRQPEVSWGSKVYAVPFGSPQLVLYYRADLFERLSLEPPKTWNEYQSLAERLADRKVLGDLAPANDATWHGVCEPLATGWASQMLLARAAPYVRQPDQYSALFDMQSMTPLIGEPPYVKALEELVAAAKLAPADAARLTPHDVRREFLAGRCAMALAWPTGARASDVGSEEKARPVSTGFAELPGGTQTYGFSERKWLSRNDNASGCAPLLAASGRLGSVTKESRRARSACNLLIWLSGKEWSGSIASQSTETTLFRTSHLSAPVVWAERGVGAQALAQYVKAVEQANARPVWLAAPRIPGRARYLAALDKAVSETVAGAKTPAEALAEAAAEWKRITGELGIEKQRHAYLRSLGLDP